MTLYKDTYRVESTRLRNWDYRFPGWYFVTVCTQSHICLFGEVVDGQMKLSPMGQMAESELLNLSVHYSNVGLDSFVVMPNHIHAIIVIEGVHGYSPGLDGAGSLAMRGASSAFAVKPGSLSAIIRSYKAGVTLRCRRNGLTGLEWQPGFYDHILRSNASVNAVRNYIQNNPANWMKDEDNPINLTKR